MASPELASSSARSASLEDMAMACQRVTARSNRTMSIAAPQAHGEKLEAALVDAQQGLATATPTELSPQVTTRPPSSSLAGDLW